MVLRRDDWDPTKLAVRMIFSFATVTSHWECCDLQRGKARDDDKCSFDEGCLILAEEGQL